MNQRTQVQLKSVIILHCLTECNKAGLSRRAYEAKLTAMLAERGVTLTGRFLTELFQEEVSQ